MKPNRLIALAAVIASASLVAGDPVPLKTTELGHGPTIVFVHGLAGSRLSWLPTARKLIAKYHVVMVDLPGHGESALPDPFSLEAAADALDGTLAKQSRDSTIVVGHAMGGLVALMAVSAHPEHARGLILIDTQLKSPMAIPEQQRQYFLDYVDQNYDQFLKMTFAKMGKDSAQGVAIHVTAAQTQPATVKAYFRYLLGVDANPSLKKLKTPMELLLTDRTWSAGKTWGAVGAQLGWEDTTACVPRHVANAGYWVMSDQPDTLASLISAFAAEKLAAKR